MRGCPSPLLSVISPPCHCALGATRLRLAFRQTPRGVHLDYRGDQPRVGSRSSRPAFRNRVDVASSLRSSPAAFLRARPRDGKTGRGYTNGLSLELPVFGLAEQVRRVFRNPGPFPGGPQRVSPLSKKQRAADVLTSPNQMTGVESFFERFFHLFSIIYNIITLGNNLIPKPESKRSGNLSTRHPQNGFEKNARMLLKHGPENGLLHARKKRAHAIDAAQPSCKVENDINLQKVRYVSFQAAV